MARMTVAELIALLGAVPDPEGYEVLVESDGGGYGQAVGFDYGSTVLGDKAIVLHDGSCGGPEVTP